MAAEKPPCRTNSHPWPCVPNTVPFNELLGLRFPRRQFGTRPKEFELESNRCRTCCGKRRYIESSEMVPETLDGADEGQKNRLTKRSPVPTFLFVAPSSCPSREARWNICRRCRWPWRYQLRRSQLPLSPWRSQLRRSQLRRSQLLLSPLAVSATAVSAAAEPLAVSATAVSAAAEPLAVSVTAVSATSSLHLTSGFSLNLVSPGYIPGGPPRLASYHLPAPHR